MTDLESIFFDGWTNFCRIDQPHLKIKIEPTDLLNLGMIVSEFKYLKP